MKTFSINENNDIFIASDGNLSISLNLQAIIYVCENVAQGQLGEMVLDVTRGIPNFQAVWIGNKNLSRFEAALRKSLNNVDGVLGVSDLQISINSNELIYSAIIVTEFGEDVLSGTSTV
jgi:hypothetical protein